MSVCVYVCTSVCLYVCVCVILVCGQFVFVCVCVSVVGLGCDIHKSLGLLTIRMHI